MKRNSRPRKTATKKATGPKPLNGVGTVITQADELGNLTTLGVVFAPNVEKLKECIKAIHHASITVNMPDIRPGQIELG